MIEISVNGERVSIDGPMTVEQVLESVEVPPNYLAVEVNGEVVPREDYVSHRIEAGDKIELVTLVGGG